MAKCIRTRIAGFNHYDGAPACLMTMRPETRLLLQPDPENPHDPKAIKIITTAGRMLGHVPKVDHPRVWECLNDKDVLVRCVKTSETFNSVRIEFHEGDPLA